MSVPEAEKGALPAMGGGAGAAPAGRSAWWMLAAAAVAYLVAWSGIYLAPVAHALLGAAGGSRGGWTLTATVLRLLVMAATLASVIFLISRATRKELSRGPAVGGLMVSVAAWVAMLLEEGRFLQGWRQPLALEFYPAVMTLCLALAASFLGLLIASICKDRNLAAAVAVVGGVVDLWGVTIGSTHEIVTHHAALHQAVSVHLPHGAGNPLVGALLGAQALVGPGDYVFIAIMLALVYKFDLQPRLSAWLIWVLLFASLIAVVYLNWSVPAIVPMAIAVLVPNRRAFRFTREERFALAYGGASLAAAALIWWAIHRRAP